jgi:hypothetical protein
MRGHMLLLPDADNDHGIPLRDVGSSCRICPLRDCPARREPSIIMDGF